MLVSCSSPWTPRAPPYAPATCAMYVELGDEVAARVVHESDRSAARAAGGTGRGEPARTIGEPIARPPRAFFAGCLDAIDGLATTALVRRGRASQRHQYSCFSLSPSRRANSSALSPLPSLHPLGPPRPRGHRFLLRRDGDGQPAPLGMVTMALVGGYGDLAEDRAERARTRALERRPPGDPAWVLPAPERQGVGAIGCRARRSTALLR